MWEHELKEQELTGTGRALGEKGLKSLIVDALKAHEGMTQR